MIYKAKEALNSLRQHFEEAEIESEAEKERLKKKINMRELVKYYIVEESWKKLYKQDIKKHQIFYR